MPPFQGLGFTRAFQLTGGALGTHTVIGRFLAGLCLALVCSLAGAFAPSTQATAADAVVSVASLPVQGQRVHALIAAGGPFASDKDGSFFFNRERRLPVRERGYYREYTVPTPGARNRGVRRIVCGGPARTPDACYYTADHYETFRRIVP